MWGRDGDLWLVLGVAVGLLVAAEALEAAWIWVGAAGGLATARILHRRRR